MQNVTVQDQTPAKKYEDNLYLRCYDPYGFWRFEDEEGEIDEIPERLSGWFTTMAQADTAYSNFQVAIGKAAVPAVPQTKKAKKAKIKDVVNTVVDNTPIF